jgi:hypothetical protein
MLNLQFTPQTASEISLGYGGSGSKFHERLVLPLCPLLQLANKLCLTVTQTYVSFLGTFDRFCGLVVRVLGYISGFDSRHYQKKKTSVSGTGSTQPREYN